MLFPGMQFSFNFFSHSLVIICEYKNPLGFGQLLVCKQNLNAYNKISNWRTLTSFNFCSSTNFFFIVLLKTSSFE